MEQHQVHGALTELRKNLEGTVSDWVIEELDGCIAALLGDPPDKHMVDAGDKMAFMLYKLKFEDNFRYEEEVEELRSAWEASKLIVLDRTNDIIREHEEEERMRHEQLISLPCPCCGKNTDDQGDCRSCDVVLLNGIHQAIDCNEFHTHTNRCFVPYEQFAKNHQGVTPNEISLQQAREGYKRLMELFPEQPKVAICPDCQEPLEEVEYNGGMFNKEQWSSMRAGDFFCSKCPTNERGAKPLKYLWKKEVKWK